MEQILDTVHIERKSESQCLVERIALGCGNDVSCIEGEYIHLESRSDGEVLAVTFILTLVVVAGPDAEPVVVGVFAADTPPHFLQAPP